MQAIITKYISPSSRRGSRVKATSMMGTLTIDWDCELSVETNHLLAAQRLVDELNRERTGVARWRRVAAGAGQLPDDSGYAVLVELA